MISAGSSHTKPAGFPNRRKEQLPGGGVEMVNGLAVHEKVSAANWAPSGTLCSGRNTTESFAAATGRAEAADIAAIRRRAALTNKMGCFKVVYSRTTPNPIR
jgi:hypothetical protein